MADPVSMYKMVLNKMRKIGSEDSLTLDDKAKTQILQACIVAASVSNTLDETEVDYNPEKAKQ